MKSRGKLNFCFLMCVLVCLERFWVIGALDCSYLCETKTKPGINRFGTPLVGAFFRIFGVNRVCLSC